MAKRSARLDVRLTNELDDALRREAKARGYASPSSFVRTSVEHELAAAEGLTGTEERLAASIEQMRREIFRLGRSQQALFAYLDSLAKVLLTCIPEPPQDAKNQAIARAKERHHRLLKSAGGAMVGDSQAAMSDLVDRGQG
jgi:Arc/MetJ-type ribon-helix-helix transcriptional regulator